MTADVLLYNALNEQRKELVKEVAALNAEIQRQDNLCSAARCDMERSLSELISCAGPSQAGAWCMIPERPATNCPWTSGLSVCDASGLYRCGTCCAWTVPAGASCARFQVWGAGAGTAQVWCCGFNPFGGTGAYASIIVPVSQGQVYTLCAGCAGCCYCCGGMDGFPSWVSGPNATLFACGGTSNRYTELQDRGYGRYPGGSFPFTYVQPGQTPGDGVVCSCMNLLCYYGYLYGCYCHNSGFICTENIVSTQGTCFGCFPQWGSISSSATKGGGGGCGIAYWIPGSWSTIKLSNYGGLFCSTHAPIYGFPDTSCCSVCYTINRCGGYCRNAEYGELRVPGAGGWANYACAGTCTFGGYGRFGMVCVSYR